jgi:hypothetical protein
MKRLKRDLASSLHTLDPVNRVFLFLVPFVGAVAMVWAQSLLWSLPAIVNVLVAFTWYAGFLAFLVSIDRAAQATMASAIAAARTPDVRRILGWSGGGVHKRIDENRELLEVLRDKAPEFLEQNPWVIGWIQSNDTFFSELARAVPISDGHFYNLTLRPDIQFPRAWPNVPARGVSTNQTAAP